MIYALEIYGAKENLPIIKDIWQLLELVPLDCDRKCDEEILDSDLEWKGFGSMTDFKTWVEEDLNSDPIYLLVDTKNKTFKYYELAPSVKITEIIPIKQIKSLKAKKKQNMDYNIPIL